MIGLRIFVRGALKGGTALIFFSLDLTFTSLVVGSASSGFFLLAFVEMLEALVREGFNDLLSPPLSFVSRRLEVCDGGVDDQ